MNRDKRNEDTQDSDWIFAAADPRTLPTERLPDRAEFDRYAAPLLADRAGSENETVDLSSLDPEDLQPGGAGDPAACPSGPAGSDAPTGAIPALGPDGEISEDGDLSPAAGSAEPAQPTYARSGTTPNAEHEGEDAAGFALPERFADLGLFDALRDVVALVCLVSALTTTFTVGTIAPVGIVRASAIGLALAALVAVHLLRWLPEEPPLRAIRLVRIIGLAPALLTAVGVIVLDLVVSIPVLFASLPDGPPLGLGVGVSLLLLGAIVGIEPRAHEGYLPQSLARSRARAVLPGIGAAASASLLVSLVMTVGRVVTTGWAYSLSTVADTIISALLLGIVLRAAVRRDRSWFVFSAAAVAGLVAAALADNTLMLKFAAPASFAAHFVYLPFLFAAFGLMISRSFVRTMPLTFERPDWLVYTVRAFEFSAIMHGAAVLWQLIAATVALAEPERGGPMLHIVDAAVCAVFLGISLFSRRALLERPAIIARSSGVIAGILLVVIGFLDVIVNSLAGGGGAGLVTGGAALAIGIAAALMLTVPAPVRDEFGAPDLAQMFADFRSRDAGRVSLLDRVPDVAEERSRKKSFPTGEQSSR